MASLQDLKDFLWEELESKASIYSSNVTIARGDAEGNVKVMYNADPESKEHAIVKKDGTQEKFSLIMVGTGTGYVEKECGASSNCPFTKIDKTPDFAKNWY